MTTTKATKAPDRHMTRAEQAAAIAAFIAANGVTRCPPGVARGVSDLETELGVSATLPAVRVTKTVKRARARRAAQQDFWDLGRQAAFANQWRAGVSLEDMAPLFRLPDADAVRAAAKDFGLHAIDRPASDRIGGCAHG